MPHVSLDHDVLLALLPIESVPAMSAWLGGEERDRLATIASGPRRAQFLAGHVLARQLAVEFAGGEAEGWHFHVGAQQHRELLGPGGRRLCLSISHSQDQVAAAIAERPIGVDLELSPEPRDWADLARRLFSPSTAAWVLGEGEAGRDRRFREAWALLEAQGKRSGDGVQRAVFRRLCLDSCEGADADALAWPVGEGSLALAGWRGMRVGAMGLSTAAMRAWTFSG
ncbi:MAG: 4'-phosphopantetheinyl transferase superfamily protein [Rhizobium sp.]|nr:4'-phosphopantetheinyl transferase superfamily protein [Rhizobium sp.]